MRRCTDLRVVAVDLPGFGLSGALPQRWRSIDGFGEAIARLVERLDLAGAVVVAHEAGALVAAAADRRLTRDDRGLHFAGAVLIASTPFPLDQGVAPSTLHRFGAGLGVRDAVFTATGMPALALDALQSRPSSFGEAAALYAFPWSTSARRRALVEMAAL